MKGLSLSTGVLQRMYGDKDALTMARDAGFDAVDMNVCYYGEGQLPDVYRMEKEEFRDYFRAVRRHADGIGIRIGQTHGLTGSYFPDEERNGELRLIGQRGIEATALLGSDKCVNHCISTFQWGWNVPDEVMHRANQAMYRDLIPVAEECGVKILLESFGGVSVDGRRGPDHFADSVKMLSEYEALPTEYKAFCLDSGHANVGARYGLQSLTEHIRLFGQRIEALHLHDNDGMGDQHLIPGQGNIDWQELFRELDGIGYEGYVNYELRMNFGGETKMLLPFLGKYLRAFTDNRGKII